MSSWPMSTCWLQEYRNIWSATFISPFVITLHLEILRIMCCSSGKLVVALFLIVLFCRTCKALDNGHQNCSSLCGDHNISSPFRLKDSADQCGDQRYELTCEHNQLAMYWESGRYDVLSINYDNYTIRARDSNIVELDSSSSRPEYSLTEYNFSRWDSYAPINARNESGDWQWYALNTNMMYVRCEHPTDSPGFLDTAPCFNTSNESVASSSSSSSYSYVCVDNGYVMDVVSLEDNCRIEVMYMTSWPAPKNNQSWSCTDIRNMLVYGFELSWLNSFCPNDRDDYYEIILGGKEPRCQTAASNNVFRKILCIILDVWGSVHATTIMTLVILWGIQIDPNDGPLMNKDAEMLESEENDLEMPNVDVSNHSSSTMSSSDLSVSNNTETPEEDGRSTEHCL